MDQGKTVFSRKIDWYIVVLRVLMQWKMLLCIGVISIVAVAGLSYVKSYKTAQNMKQLQENGVELTQDEMDDVVVYNEQKQLLEHQRVYNEESYLMNLDPKQHYKGELCYHIKNSGDEDAAEVLITSIKNNLLSDSELKSDVKEIIASDSFMQTYAEIITVKNSQNDETELQELYIVVRHNDEQLCEKLLLCVKTYMDNNWRNVSYVSENISAVMDVELIDYQKQQINAMTTYINTIDGLKSKLNDKQRNYIAQLDADTTEITYSVGISWKLVVVGTIAILFGIVLLLVVYYLVSDKVYVEDEIKEFPGAMVLGVLKEKEVKSKFYNMIVKRSRYDFEMDENDKIIIMLQKLCRKMRTEKAIIVGECSDAVKKRTDSICSKLKECGIEVEMKSQLADKEILLGEEKMAVIVLVKVGKRTHRNLGMMAEFACENGIDISGIIMTE